MLPSRMFWFAIVIIFIVIDQLSKLVASQFGWPIFFNDQFAFSLPLPSGLMYLIYALVLTGMSTYVHSAWNRLNQVQRWAWVFVFAGGLSNIGERLVLGYVRDFIPVASGTLNFADFFILIGLMLFLAGLRHSGPAQSSEKLS